MIVIECYLDEYLVKSLGFSKRKIKHQSGKGRVLKTLRRCQGRIGVVDEDPDSTQPRDIENYVEISQTENLRLLKRKDNDNIHLIIISEYLEDWIVKRARHNEVRLGEYGFEANAEFLHNIPHIEKIPEFQLLLNKLIEIDEEIRTLKNWLSTNSE